MTGRANVIIVAASALVLLAACGSAPPTAIVATLPSPSTASAPNASGTAGPAASGETAEALAYAECMRSNGIPSWPDPNSRGGFDKSKLTAQQLDATDAQIQSAETACQHLLPTSSGGGARPRPAPGAARSCRAV